MVSLDFLTIEGRRKCIYTINGRQGIEPLHMEPTDNHMHFHPLSSRKNFVLICFAAGFCVLLVFVFGQIAVNAVVLLSQKQIRNAPTPVKAVELYYTEYLDNSYLPTIYEQIATEVGPVVIYGHTSSPNRLPVQRNPNKEIDLCFATPLPDTRGWKLGSEHTECLLYNFSPESPFFLCYNVPHTILPMRVLYGYLDADFAQTVEFTIGTNKPIIIQPSNGYFFILPDQQGWSARQFQEYQASSTSTADMNAPRLQGQVVVRDHSNVIVLEQTLYQGCE